MATHTHEKQIQALRALLALRKSVWAAGISPDASGTAPGGGTYRYHSLHALIQTTWPICHDHGFVVTWDFVQNDVGPAGVLLCTLVHTETGHEFSSGVPWCAQPVPVVMGRDGATQIAETPAWAQSLRQRGTPIQAMGATLTFLRRYSLELALGIAVDRDTDGAAAAAPPVATITEEQVKALRAAAQRLPDQVARARTAQVQQQHGCHLHHLPPQAFASVLKVFEAPVTAVAVPTEATPSPAPAPAPAPSPAPAPATAPATAVSTTPPTFDPSTVSHPGSPPGSLSVAQLDTLRREVQKLPPGGEGVQRILALGAELSPTGAMDALPARHVPQLLQAIRAEQELVATVEGAA